MENTVKAAKALLGKLGHVASDTAQEHKECEGCIHPTQWITPCNHTQVWNLGGAAGQVISRSREIKEIHETEDIYVYLYFFFKT